MSFRSMKVFAGLLVLAGALVGACSDPDPGGGGGNGGSGGNGAGGDSCDTFGPVNEEQCFQEGARCYFADTSCSMTWICEGGLWKTAGCYPEQTGSGGASGTGGSGATSGAGGSGG